MQFLFIITFFALVVSSAQAKLKCDTAIEVAAGKHRFFRESVPANLSPTARQAMINSRLKTLQSILDGKAANLGNLNKTEFLPNGLNKLNAYLDTHSWDELARDIPAIRSIWRDGVGASAATERFRQYRELTRSLTRTSVELEELNAQSNR